MSGMEARWLGVALLALAGALAGVEKQAQLRRKLKCLEELCAALGRMAGELRELQTPMPQLLARLERCRFFLLVSAGFGGEPLEQLWRRAAQLQPIPEADRETLGELGGVIGRCDAPRQAAEIEQTRRRLAESAAALEQELRQRGRHYPGLGAALGAMLAVILY